MFLCWFQQQDVDSSLSESQEPKLLSLNLRRGNSTKHHTKLAMDEYPL